VSTFPHLTFMENNPRFIFTILLTFDLMHVSVVLLCSAEQILYYKNIMILENSPKYF